LAASPISVTVLGRPGQQRITIDGGSSPSDVEARTGFATRHEGEDPNSRGPML
jgi:hypothetical protein